MFSFGIVILLCVAASLADVIGGFIPVAKNLNRAQVAQATALASGFLIGATFLDRLPDTMSWRPSWSALLIVFGYLTALWLQHISGGGHAHVHGVQRTNGHASNVEGHGLAEATVPHAVERQAGLVMFGTFLVHTFMDGVVIAGSFAVSIGAGLLMFLAITIHKIPEGFTMASVSLAAGSTRTTAMWSSIGLALSTLAGAGITLVLGTVGGAVTHILMAFATGTFIFISTTGLIPSLGNRNQRAVWLVILGCVLFYGSLRLVQVAGLQ